MNQDEIIKELQTMRRRIDELIFMYTREFRSESSEHQLEKIVTKYMIKMGIPANLKGYNYIRCAVMMYIQEGKISATKIMYPRIAEEYKTTPSRVERAIRHAIEVAMARGQKDLIDNIFGYTISANKGKLTNTEFIATLADKIRLEISK